MPALVGVDPAAAAPAATTVVGGRNYPAMFTVAPDGRIFYSELWSGRIGVFDPATGSDTTYFQVPNLCNTRDQGLYGLALHPNYPQTSTLYAYVTRLAADGTCHNQVVRIASSGGQLGLTVLLSDPYVGGHIGGRVLFGPGGNLYVATGDGASGLATAELAGAQEGRAQELGSLKGKLLRITPDGTAPADNPFPNNPVFAYGFRNVFGFDFDPATGRLWATDNGPDPEHAGEPFGPGPNGGCNDELDLVLKGANYGWGPKGTCGKPPEAPFNTNQDGPSPVLPALNIEAATGITGARFCQGCGLGPDYEGRLFYVRYGSASGSGAIHAATLSADRSTVVSDTLVYRPAGPSPLSIERGPDGALYYSDSQAIHKLVPSGGTTSPSPITLRAALVSATTVNLKWSGATATSIDVWRRPAGTTNFTKVGVSSNDGNANDSPGNGTWDYRVCNGGTSTCSNVATVTV
ncbi:MAG TPA: PQQ-dependent sugar dehydrogenase [Acidimicrobiales bacterium]|nr:PQQ-dependent sugar dehydrogenase [Acidimicrobiales bacterium]